MKKACFLIFITILLILATQPLVFATGFETEEVPLREETKVKTKFSFSKYNTKKRSFANFDVNQEGMIALVSNTGAADPTVYIYNKAGTFQYKYVVDTTGVICAEWEGDNLWIYVVRADYAVLVDNAGAVLKVERILDTKENTAYWYEVRSKQKTVSDETYTAKKGLGLLGIFVNDYAQVVITDESGEKEIVYNVSSVLLKKALLTMLVVSFFAFAGVSAIILAVKSGIRYQNRMRFGSDYTPNTKRTFYDRILDIFERREEASNNEDESS